MTHSTEFNLARREAYHAARRVGLRPREAGHIYGPADFDRKVPALLARRIDEPIVVSKRGGRMRVIPKSVLPSPAARQKALDQEYLEKNAAGERFLPTLSHPAGQLIPPGAPPVGYFMGHNYVRVRITSREENEGAYHKELATLVFEEEKAPTYARVLARVQRIMAENAGNYPRDFVALDILDIKFIPDLSLPPNVIIPPALRQKRL